MTTVFLGGSRHISRLSPQVRERLEKMIERDLPIVIGDANGADKAMQGYLFDRGYQNVEVFCSGRACRNNLGGWKVRNVAVGAAKRDAHFYSAKDEAMAVEASVGLMLWDGKSVGTIANVFRLIVNGKKAVVYNAPEKRFHELRDERGWDDFAAEFDSGLRDKLDERVGRPSTKGETRHSTLFG